MSRRSDEGAATVLALASCAVISLVAAVLAGAGLAAVTRHRAALAADAAALAGAARSASRPEDACRVARQALEANGARLRGCFVDGPYVVVRSLVSPPAWIAWAGPAVGEARSGPDADAEKTGGVASAS
jgi:secretion/DNA translocation related TadE-like protein